MEFGLGQSTKMLAQYCLYNKNAYLTSIEHDKTWIQKYIENNNIPDNVEIKYHKNEAIFINNKKSLSVNNLVNTTANIKYDLIVVDAPYGSDNYSRPQILKLIPNNIKRDSFCIIIDDYNRTGEKETVRELEKVLSNNSIDFEKGIYSGEKESIVICSPKFRHILTL